MRFATFALISAQLICVALLSANQAEAAGVKWPADYMNDAKNYLITMFRDRVVSRSVIVGDFEQTMGKIKARYAEAKEAGQLDGMTDDEAQAFYYKIVVDEMRKLRADIDARAQKDKNPATPETDLKPEHKEILNELESDKVADDEEGDLLSNELDEIESNEAEMGWSMSPEAKAAMKARTKKVMTDLMSNEMRQLAMAILTSYFTGGPISSVVTTAVAASVKFKLIEYLMNTVLDALNSCMGREIHITSAVPAAPIAA